MAHRKSKKKRPKRWGLRTLALLLVAAGIGFSVLFARVDREVAAALEGRSTTAISALVSDSFVIRRGDTLRSSILTHELRARRYREVVGEPESPGEFTVRGPEFLVYVRDYRAADGSLRDAQLVSLIPTRGEVRLVDGSSIPSIAIEPQVIAPLGSHHNRATDFRSLDEFPTSVKDAVLAIEDQRFYQHLGIDPIGIGRAMVENIMALRIVQGGSTITQQLAKNLIFTPERTLGRKIMEAVAALSIELRLSKDQILEHYLNEVYLGQEGAIAIHGFAAAAQSYFGKRVEDLSLAEAALLAGLIQAPSAYAPRRHLARARERQLVVLNAMVNTGAISERARGEAAKEKLTITPPTFRSRVAPHFTAAILRDLQERLNLPTALLSGVTVYTGLREEFQRCGETALRTGLEEIEKRHPKLKRRAPALEGALVAIEPHSGKIRAWVGGREYSRNQFDHVYQAERPIGSTVKPFLYLTALDGSLNSYKVATAATTLLDEPIEIAVPGGKVWRTENYDEQFRGPVSLREALESSLNMPAVYAAQRFGIPALARTLTNFRVADGPPAVPALALGAIDTNLLRLTAAFGALANGGIYVEPRLFVSVLDAQGSSLATGAIVEQVVSQPGPTFVLTHLMRGVLDNGTGKAIRSAGFHGDAAGKTGTSNESRDAWFVGFTPDLVAGVWIGFDDNRETGLTGGGAAAPIWGAFMKCLEPHREEIQFIPPRDAVELRIDRRTGLLVTNDCPSDDYYAEYFVRGTEPPTRCSLQPERASSGDNEASPPREEREPWWRRIL